MSTISIYHNDRVDGGRRTGLEVDGERAFERFKTGKVNRDPTIRWYLDLNLPVKNTLATQRDCAKWLREHGDVIVRMLEEARDRLTGGYDADGFPWEFTRNLAVGRAELKIQAQRRFSAQNIGEYLARFLERDWKQFLKTARTIERG